MMRVCHRVLYKQLAVWMLHGILADKYSEFFVHKVEKVARVESSSNEDEDLGLGGITSLQIQQMIVSQKFTNLVNYSILFFSQIQQIISSLSLYSQKVSEDEVKGQCEQFTLRVEMLPSYIPARVAEKILFVGESVQMFESEREGTCFKSRGWYL